MPTVIDQMQRRVEVPDKPLRIVSIVPSQTELLEFLGLDEQVVGITKFCIHPNNWYRTKKRVGGTKQLNLEEIAALKPDLIIGNKEENDEQQVKWLMERFPVWMSDVRSFDQCWEMMLAIGQLTNTEKRAEQLVEQLKLDVQVFPQFPPMRTAYFIWRDPWMLAGGDNFIDVILEQLGLVNIYKDLGRYPCAEDGTLAQDSPELILLSSEPYPFKHKHIQELERLCPNAEIVLVDGEMFSWYGSRLVFAKDYFDRLHYKLMHKK